MAASLLVGSMNLESADAVFAAVGDILREDVTRVPDGETGDRLNWIAALEPQIAETPGLERTSGTWGEAETRHAFALFRPVSGVAASDIEFGNLGYADDAVASYAQFAAAVQRGVLPEHIRFQVSLPTAFMALMAYIDLDARDALTPAYERALEREIDRMLAVIPASRLAIQWDCPCEVGVTEQVGPPNIWTLDDVAAELGRMAALVPEQAELGFHMCYGDPPDEATGHGKHWMEPADAGAMVRLTNAMLGHIARRVDWVHMPVPIARGDDDFYAPLAGLRLPDESELYLGLVHFEDGIDGARRRADAAARHVSAFGVATECGLGRIPRDEVLPTLRTHHDLDLAVSASR